MEAKNLANILEILPTNCFQSFPNFIYYTLSLTLALFSIIYLVDILLQTVSTLKVCWQMTAATAH